MMTDRQGWTADVSCTAYYSQKVGEMALETKMIHISNKGATLMTLCYTDCHFGKDLTGAAVLKKDETFNII